MAKKYYVVWKGNQEGVFDSWGECKAQIDGFKGAEYKSFKTYQEAQEAYSRGNVKNYSSKSSSSKSRDKDLNKEHIQDLLESGKVVVFTDGGALGNPGVGGYGIVLKFRKNSQEFVKELKRGFRLTTNNRMELLGVIEALKAIKDPAKTIELFSDSRYVVDAITKGWAKSWQAKGWVKSNKARAKNSDLWEEFLALAPNFNVNFHWVKGHAGIEENERCDELAGMAMESEDLLVDDVYEKEKAQLTSDD